MTLRNKFRGFKEIWGFDNRWWLTFTKTFFRGENLQIYRYKGAEILVDHAGGDANGAREVLTSPMYSRFLSRMELSKPANVLDLGANNGGFPILLQTSGAPLRKVVSVEFNPQTFIRLHFNVTRNLECKVVPLNAALCGEARDIRLSLGKGSVSDSIYGASEGNDLKAVTVSGLTLDNFIDRHFAGEVVDICKIDVEGAEFEVFEQPHHGSIRRCRYVIMEIHERGGRTAGEIVPVIESLGLERQPLEDGADPSVHFFINSHI